MFTKLAENNYHTIRGPPSLGVLPENFSFKKFSLLLNNSKKKRPLRSMGTSGLNAGYQIFNSYYKPMVLEK